MKEGQLCQPKTPARY